MPNPLVECVPNFSEGRRPEVIAEIVAAIQKVSGVILLDTSSDADHNRTVVTFAGPPDAVEKAAFAGIATAARLIDLNNHRGEHPRLGATDVVPFIPLRDVTMADCVAMARRLGERVGRELDIPVYLYEAAATRPDRENLADVRRGEYEGLKEAIGTDPDRRPDFGPAALGPAGATVIGARAFLIAFNVYLNTADVEIANQIARAIRHSSGGLRYVKAMGVLVEGKAQVSMNLTHFEKTPLHRVMEMIRREAARYGVTVAFSELVGLIPGDALIDSAQWYLQLDRFEKSQVLERRLLEAAPAEAGPGIFTRAVAADTVTPGGGAVAAAAGALAAALAEMVSRLTVGKKKYADVAARMSAVADEAASLRTELLAAVDEDIAAFNALVTAYRLPKEDPVRPDAIRAAMTEATDVPLRVTRTALEVIKLAGAAATAGNLNAVTDAMAGVHMALAAVEVAALNVRINTAAMADPAAAARYNEAVLPLVSEARTLSAGLLAQAAARADLAL